jgi:hypothetical protein
MAEGDPDQLSFKFTPDVAQRFTRLRDLVHKAGHHRPSQKVLTEALIWAAEQDGRKLELEVIAPYRQKHPEAD